MALVLFGSRLGSVEMIRTTDLDAILFRVLVHIGYIITDRKDRNVSFGIK